MANESCTTLHKAQSSAGAQKPEFLELLRIARIQKSQREDILIRIIGIEGRFYADVRAYFHASNGELRPTRKGITMGLGPLLEVIRALPEALDILYEAGDRAGDRWATDRGDRIGAREPGQTEHRRQEPDLKPEAAELESVTRS